MIASKTREKWNTKMVILITAILSFVLVVISFLLDTTHQDAKNILISVACSIWASNLIMYATSEYMLRSARRKEIIDKWGLESMFRTRAEMNSSSNLALVSCKRHIDIIAFGLKNFREVQNDLIKSLLKDGVEIRILTLSPNSDLLAHVDVRENELEGSTKKSIKDLLDWVDNKNKDLGKKAKGKITLKTYDFLPLDFYFRVDDHIYVGPYLKGMSSQQMLSMEYSHGEGTNFWKGYFEDQWNNLP